MAGDIFGLTGLNVSALSTGQSVSPVLTFSSETSLGFYRSAASTIAQSYGTTVLSTVSLTGTLRATEITGTSGISVGSSSNTGTLINAISARTCTLVAHVVQGSASSFTVLVWPAAKPLDGFITVPQTGAVSSLSSGLVLHSHCTQAGQIEIRLSNVSTLAQNQSAITLALYRFSAF